MEVEVTDDVKREMETERAQIVHQLDDWLEIPMLVLSIIWLALFVIEMTRGVSPFLETISNVIWIIFGIDFAVKLLFSPNRLEYLKSNWLTLLALALPALRIFRAFRALRLLRAARAARGLRLVRLLTSINRGMRSLGATFSRRGFGYVLMLTLIIIFAGAAGMYSFEKGVAGGFVNYADSLWWTAMIITSIGSDYFPETAEGRMLCLLLSIYGFAVFGYVTATLATFFVQRDSETAAERGEPCISDLHNDLTDLKARIDLLGERLARS
ncbi:MAG: potassium channel family protein [bacterium]|nr:potassium channel family protein [bacterium]